uniref:PAK1 interacting protein 1 n=1 Tax=Junco hyemalis TaxID=40217 RepID=A0A8C5JK29_JUNHY
MKKYKTTRRNNESRRGPGLGWFSGASAQAPPGPPRPARPEAGGGPAALGKEKGRTSQPNPPLVPNRSVRAPFPRQQSPILSTAPPPPLAIPALTPLVLPAAITASAASAPRGPPCAGCLARSLTPRRFLRRFPLRGGSHGILLTRAERAPPDASAGPARSGAGSAADGRKSQREPRGGAVRWRMELVAGCYEQVLLGFATRPGQSWTVVPDFTHHAHTASLSAVAVNNRYVVTGSRDETIQIYDMKKKIEHGALLQHNGTITSLEFYGTSHLLSGAEDGLICIWNTKRWECLKSIKAHKGHVTSLSIHPSGKLALSVGTDKTLRTWNLVEGRSAFIKNLKQNAHIIKWSPDGEKYVTVIANKVDIYRLDTASITGTITTEKRISSLRFITDFVLAIAGDDEMIRFYSCDTQKCLCEFKAHENRIKDIYSFEREGQHVIVTASSDGYIKMWNLDLEKIRDGPSLLCEVNTKARLTCLAVWLDQASEMKENSDKTATSSQETEDEKSSIARTNKDFWTTKRVKILKRKRKIIPEKQKLEAPVPKKKKKQNSSA